MIPHTYISDHIVVREGCLADANALGELWLLLAEEIAPGATHDVLTWKSRYMQWHSKKDLVHYVIQVADLAGELVGFMDGVVYYDNYTSRNILEGLHMYVLPIWRIPHVTHKLYRSSIREALSRYDADMLRVHSQNTADPRWLRKKYKLHAQIFQKELRPHGN